MGPISLLPCSSQHSWKSSSCPDSWTSCTHTCLSGPCWTGGWGRGCWGWIGVGGHGIATASLLLHSTEGGSLTAGVQILPAEAGIYGVPDRSKGAGGAQAASPQLRPQLPALGGPIIRCSCASQPAREQMPHRNGGVPCVPSPEKHLPRSVRGR